MAVYQLDDDLWFPDPHGGEPDGLVAIGGDLSVERLCLAYYYGFFPWFSFKAKEEPWWYCPMQRFVIFPKEIHVSHSMRQMLRRKDFRVTFNKQFVGVIWNCSTANNRDREGGAWLGDDMMKAYTELHHRGLATSVEVWQDTEKDGWVLAGGLYGVTMRKAFFGESMFSLVPSASKLALIHLARAMEEMGWLFIDCQFETPHLRSMGGRHIPYDDYMDLLNGKEKPEAVENR